MHIDLFIYLDTSKFSKMHGILKKANPKCTVQTAQEITLSLCRKFLCHPHPRAAAAAAVVLARVNLSVAEFHGNGNIEHAILCQRFLAVSPAFYVLMFIRVACFQ